MNRAIFWTAIWVILVVLMSGYNFWVASVKVHLNEIGDFIAGAMSPLAIFWLVMVYLQQRKEMREQVAQTEKIAQETQKQVAVMEAQFYKQQEPLFVFAYNRLRPGNIPPQDKIFSENVGGIATNLEWEFSDGNNRIIKLETYLQKISDDGSVRNLSRKESTFIGKDQGFILSLDISNLEKDCVLNFKIFYKDSIGRRYAQLRQYKNTDSNDFLRNNFFSGRAQLVE